MQNNSNENAKKRNELSSRSIVASVHKNIIKTKCVIFFSWGRYVIETWNCMHFISLNYMNAFKTISTKKKYQNWVEMKTRICLASYSKLFYDQWPMQMNFMNLINGDNYKFLAHLKLKTEWNIQQFYTCFVII